MNLFRRRQQHWFDAWLDHRFADRPAKPAPEEHDLSGDDHLSEMTTAALALHTRESVSADPATPEEQHAIWESIMRQHPTPVTTRQAAPTVRQDAPVMVRRGPHPTWAGALTAVIVATVVVALFAGFQGIRERDSGSGESTESAMLVASASPAWTTSGTPSDSSPVIDQTPSEVCTTPPMSSADLVDIVYRSTGSLSPRTQKIVGYVEDYELQLYLLNTSRQFFQCFWEGKPLSALALASEPFIKEWVYTHLLTRSGGLSPKALEDFVAELEQQQERGESMPIDASDVQMTFWSDLAGIETSDGRLHYPLHWMTDSQIQNQIPGFDPYGFPNDISFIEENGVWKIDTFRFEILTPY